MIVETYITSKGCDIWEITTDRQTEKMVACLCGNLIARQQLSLLDTQSANSVHSKPHANPDIHIFRARVQLSTNDRQMQATVCLVCRSIVNGQFPKYHILYL